MSEETEENGGGVFSPEVPELSSQRSRVYYLTMVFTLARWYAYGML